MTVPDPTPPHVPEAIHCVAGSLVGAYPGALVIWDDCDIGSGHTHGSVMLVDGAKCLIRCKGGDVVALWTKDLHVELSSPLAMCHAARWLATRLGMDPGSTAPTWEKRGELWLLVAKNRLTGKSEVVARWSLPTDDPAEALAAACMAVGGAS